MRDKNPITLTLILSHQGRGSSSWINIMKYRAVIFDLFGTLVYNTSPKESEDNLAQMASVLAIAASDMIQLWTETYCDRQIGVYKSYQENIKHICRLLNSPADPEQIERAAAIRRDMLKRELFMVREDALEVISHIKEKGIKSGLITNCPADTETLWKDTPLAPLIDVPVFSSAEGIMKPDARIYQVTVGRLAVSPQKCIYIADGGIDGELKTAGDMRMLPILIDAYCGEEQISNLEKWQGTTIESIREVLMLLD